MAPDLVALCPCHRVYSTNSSVPVFGIKPSITISVTAAQEVPMPRLFDVPGGWSIMGFDRNEEVIV